MTENKPKTTKTIDQHLFARTDEVAIEFSHPLPRFLIFSIQRTTTLAQNMQLPNKTSSTAERTHTQTMITFSLYTFILPTCLQDLCSATEVFWHSGALQIGLLLLLLFFFYTLVLHSQGVRH